MKREDKVFASVLVLVLLVTAGMVTLVPAPARQIGQSGQLASFQTYDQMKNFIAQSSNIGYFRTTAYTATFSSFAPAAAGALEVGVTSAPSFTTTNVQVQGIDEPDFVKTDGTYMYVARGSTVSVIRAYPPQNASLVDTLRFDTEVQGIFISPGRLIVITSGFANGSKLAYVQTTSLQMFDVSDVSAPALIKSISVSGSFIDARLTDGYVYAIFQQPTEFLADGNASVVAPVVVDGKVSEAIQPSSVFYSTSSGVPFSMYTIILSMKVSDGSHTQNAVLTGWGSTVYASNSNVYLAFPDRSVYPLALGVAVGGIRTVPLGAPRLLPFWWGGWGSNTTIFRIAYSNGNTGVAAEGTVPGTILNQFSLDEYNGYLRVATTSNSRLANQSWVQVNNVYVLDQDLKVSGALEGLAPNEKVYSVRFLGEVGYVVTYERIDPLFAISFANPTHPTVLSALVLTGFSDYLHPLGNGYLLGVGKQTLPAPSESGYVLYEGMKLSLFHVSANGTSTEVARVLIGDRGSDSPVSTDHRAFVYLSSTGLVALPILVAQVKDNSSAGGFPSFEYGTPVFQGAYLFNFSAAGGFDPIGRITQVPSSLAVQDAGDYYINRIVVIGGYAYTVSGRAVVATDLLTLTNVGAVKLPQ